MFHFIEDSNLKYTKSINQSLFDSLEQYLTIIKLTKKSILLQWTSGGPSSMPLRQLLIYYNNWLIMTSLQNIAITITDLLSVVNQNQEVRVGMIRKDRLEKE